jgi:small basic protein
MALYTILVLLCRADLKIAIPSSVIIMAFGSVVGIVAKILTSGVQPGVYENWLAAAPIVALGAPLGVFAVELIGRKPTLLFVAALCVGQFIWTCWNERVALGPIGLAVSLASVGVMLFGFEKLRIWGGRIVDEQRRRNEERSHSVSASS